MGTEAQGAGVTHQQVEQSIELPPELQSQINNTKCCNASLSFTPKAIFC